MPPVELDLGLPVPVVDPIPDGREVEEGGREFVQREGDAGHGGVLEAELAADVANVVLVGRVLVEVVGVQGGPGPQLEPAELLVDLAASPGRPRRPSGRAWSNRDCCHDDCRRRSEATRCMWVATLPGRQARASPTFAASSRVANRSDGTSRRTTPPARVRLEVGDVDGQGRRAGPRGTATPRSAAPRSGPASRRACTGRGPCRRATRRGRSSCAGSGRGGSA